MRDVLNYLLLLILKGVSAIFWRHESRWVGEPLPGDRWSDIRVVCILNHTSLYEWVFAALPPARFLRDIAYHGVVPVAEKTINRRLVGAFYGAVAAHVVPISRQRDHTWHTVLSKVDDPKAMVVILPEGHMMRRDGLDSKGNPLRVRGGIAEILESVEGGGMLLAYSGGLHHVQAPGEPLPRLFRTVKMDFERVDIAAYREARRREVDAGEAPTFRAAVKADLEARRDRLCPAAPESAPGLFMSPAERRAGAERKERERKA